MVTTDRVDRLPTAAFVNPDGSVGIFGHNDTPEPQTIGFQLSDGSSATVTVGPWEMFILRGVPGTGRVAADATAKPSFVIARPGAVLVWWRAAASVTRNVRHDPGRRRAGRTAGDGIGGGRGPVGRLDRGLRAELVVYQGAVGDAGAGSARRTDTVVPVDPSLSIAIAPP